VKRRKKMPPRDKRHGNYGQATGIYDNRYHLEQMVLHYFYREGMKQRDIATEVGTSIGVVHKIVHTVELKEKPFIGEPFVFNLKDIPRIGEGV
jgi:hypothetical protein